MPNTIVLTKPAPVSPLSGKGRSHNQKPMLSPSPLQDDASPPRTTIGKNATIMAFECMVPRGAEFAKAHCVYKMAIEDIEHDLRIDAKEGVKELHPCQTAYYHFRIGFHERANWDEISEWYRQECENGEEQEDELALVAAPPVRAVDAEKRKAVDTFDFGNIDDEDLADDIDNIKEAIVKSECVEERCELMRSLTRLQTCQLASFAKAQCVELEAKIERVRNEVLALNEDQTQRVQEVGCRVTRMDRSVTLVDAHSRELATRVSSLQDRFVGFTGANGNVSGEGAPPGQQPIPQPPFELSKSDTLRTPTEHEVRTCALIHYVQKCHVYTTCTRQVMLWMSAAKGARRSRALFSDLCNLLRLSDCPRRGKKNERLPSQRAAFSRGKLALDAREIADKFTAVFWCTYHLLVLEQPAITLKWNEHEMPSVSSPACVYAQAKDCDPAPNNELSFVSQDPETGGWSTGLSASAEQLAIAAAPTRAASPCA